MSVDLVPNNLWMCCIVQSNVCRTSQIGWFRLCQIILAEYRPSSGVKNGTVAISNGGRRKRGREREGGEKERAFGSCHRLFELFLSSITVEEGKKREGEIVLDDRRSLEAFGWAATPLRALRWPAS